MLSKKIEKALNEQIVKEAYASNSYLSMASWCETKGLPNCAKFFYVQSEEEREHMMRLVKYVNEAGGHALAPHIKQPPAAYKSLLNVFETSLEQEIAVSKSINKIVEQSFAAKDYATFNMLQWFVGEQVEEENLFRSAIDMVKLAGSDGRGQLMVDNAIDKIRTQAGN